MVNSGDELVAALGAARAELVRTEQEAAAARGNAPGEVAAARGRVDEFRFGLIEDAFESGRRLNCEHTIDRGQTLEVPPSVARLGNPGVPG